jgi:hypothetical protein
MQANGSSYSEGCYIHGQPAWLELANHKSSLTLRKRLNAGSDNLCNGISKSGLVAEICHAWEPVQVLVGR